MTQQTLAEKLLKIQKTLAGVRKGSENSHFRSSYADINDVYAVAKPALNAEDILVLHRADKDANGQYVTTELVHGNEVILTKMYLSGSEDNMQKIGAANTYAKRQGLKSLLAMEEIDDDGETAVGRGLGAKGSPGTNGKTSNGAKNTPSEKPPVAGEKQSSGGGKTAPLTERGALNALIRQTGKVLADKKVQTMAETGDLIRSYGVKTTEELTDEQANEVAGLLKGKLA